MVTLITQIIFNRTTEHGGMRQTQSKDITSVWRLPPPPAHHTLQPTNLHNINPRTNSKVQPLYNRCTSSADHPGISKPCCRPRRAHIARPDPQPLTSRIRIMIALTRAVALVARGPTRAQIVAVDFWRPAIIHVPTVLLMPFCSGQAQSPRLLQSGVARRRALICPECP